MGGEGLRLWRAILRRFGSVSGEQPSQDDPPVSDGSCELWSAELNALLDRHGIAWANVYVARVGSIDVWIANWPYAFGSRYVQADQRLPDFLRPERPPPNMETRLRLRAIVSAWFAENSPTPARQGDEDNRGEPKQCH